MSPTTGSLLIYHDPVSVSRETLLALLCREGYTKARDASPRRRRFALGAVGFWLVRAVCLAAART